MAFNCLNIQVYHICIFDFKLQIIFCNNPSRAEILWLKWPVANLAGVSNFADCVWRWAGWVPLFLFEINSGRLRNYVFPCSCTALWATLDLWGARWAGEAYNVGFRLWKHEMVSQGAVLLFLFLRNVSDIVGRIHSCCWPWTVTVRWRPNCPHLPWIKYFCRSVVRLLSSSELFEDVVRWSRRPCVENCKHFKSFCSGLGSLLIDICRKNLHQRLQFRPKEEDFLKFLFLLSIWSLSASQVGSRLTNGPQWL